MALRNDAPGGVTHLHRNPLTSVTPAQAGVSSRRAVTY